MIPDILQSSLDDLWNFQSVHQVWTRGPCIYYRSTSNNKKKYGGHLKHILFHISIFEIIAFPNSGHRWTPTNKTNVVVMPPKTIIISELFLIEIFKIRNTFEEIFLSQKFCQNANAEANPNESKIFVKEYRPFLDDLGSAWILGTLSKLNFGIFLIRMDS